MSTPELRDGDTILVRAEIKTFSVLGPDCVDRRVPTAFINGHSYRFEELTGGWLVEDRKIRVGDHVKVKGKFDSVGEVLAVSPPEVVPEQYWVRFPETWVVKTHTRDQLERMPVA